VCDLESLTPGRPQVHHIDEVPVLVVRTADDDVDSADKADKAADNADAM